jgi:hypothetical protein
MRYACPHCGAVLKVSRRTIKTAVISGVVCFPLVFFVIRFVDSLYLENEAVGNLLGMGIVILLLLPAAFWDWKTGSYELQKPGHN